MISSLAGAGSLSLELSLLSELSGRPEFGAAGQGAVKALLERRTPLGLLGKHVNIRTGKVRGSCRVCRAFGSLTHDFVRRSLFVCLPLQVVRVGGRAWLKRRLFL